MPRTPLLRSLVALAAEHRASRRSGKPLEVVREEAARGRKLRLSRRDFLVGATAATGAVLLPRFGALAAGGTTARIAIVGGGMSGLTAALMMVDAGLSPTLYEASPRLGGRMKSEGAPGKFGCGSCHDVWIVVVQEIFGVTAHIRDVVDAFAAAGYHAVAPAMFDRLDPASCCPTLTSRAAARASPG